jgi:hypothetical protein
MEHIKNNKFIYITFLITLIALLSAASNQFFIQFINSDYLLIAEIAKNVLHTKSIAGQNFPAAPYFFPDTFIAICLEGFSKNITVTHFLYSFLFLSTYCYLVYNLFRKTSISRSLAEIGTFIALSISFTILPLQLTFLRDWPGSHLSMFLYSLFFIGYYIQNRNLKPTVIRTALLFIGTYLFFISDNLLFAQLMFPLSVLIIFDLLLKKSNKYFSYSLLALFLLVIMCSLKITDLLTTYFDASFSLNVSLFRIRKAAKIGLTIHQALSVFADSIKENMLFYGVLFICHLSNLILGLVLYLKHKSGRIQAEKLINVGRILAFLYIAQLSNIMLAILVGKLHGAPDLRYTDIIDFFPAIGLALLIITFLNNKLYTLTLTLFSITFIASCLAIFFNTNYLSLKQFSFNAPYNTSVQCLDELANHYHLKNGLAEFWNVRSVRMLSKNGLVITQINNNLDFQNLSDNRRFFYEDVKHKTPYRYQFIIVDNLPREKIKTVVGKPDSIVHCDNREIWLYAEKDSSEKLNSYFTAKLNI